MHTVPPTDSLADVRSISSVRPGPTPTRSAVPRRVINFIVQIIINLSVRFLNVSHETLQGPANPLRPRTLIQHHDPFVGTHVFYQNDALPAGCLVELRRLLTDQPAQVLTLWYPDFWSATDDLIPQPSRENKILSRAENTLELIYEDQGGLYSARFTRHDPGLEHGPKSQPIPTARPLTRPQLIPPPPK